MLFVDGFSGFTAVQLDIIRVLFNRCREVNIVLTLDPSAAAPVRRGQRVGSLRVTVGGEQIAELPICAAEDVARIGFGGLFAKLALSLLGA